MNSRGTGSKPDYIAATGFGSQQPAHSHSLVDQENNLRFLNNQQQQQQLSSTNVHASNASIRGNERRRNTPTQQSSYRSGSASNARNNTSSVMGMHNYVVSNHGHGGNTQHSIDSQSATGTNFGTTGPGGYLE